MTFLAVENLSFAYADRQPVLRDLSFTMPAGGILGLAGANGSGKSTLINILAGLLEPDSGLIRLGSESDQAVRGSLRRRSSLLPQNIDHWLLGETGFEDLTLGLDLSDPDTRSLLDDLISRWHLNDFLDQPVETLSLGQKKKLGLVSALARRPAAVFLDEPLAGLDWAGIKIMVDDLARLKEAGVIAVVVTHDPGPLAGVIDRWLLLKRGGEYHFGDKPYSRFEEYGVRPLLIDGQG